MKTAPTYIVSKKMKPIRERTRRTILPALWKLEGGRERERERERKGERVKSGYKLHISTHNTPLSHCITVLLLHISTEKLVIRRTAKERNTQTTPLADMALWHGVHTAMKY